MVAIAPMTEGLLENVERIRPVVEKFAAQGEADRQVPDPVYDALMDAGIFRLLAPKAFGGMELHPVEAYRVWEALARIDSSTGWNAMIASNAAATQRLPARRRQRRDLRGRSGRGSGWWVLPARGCDAGRWRLARERPHAVRERLAAGVLAPDADLGDGRRCAEDSIPDTGEPTPMLAYLPSRRTRNWSTPGIRSGCAAPAPATWPCATCSSPTNASARFRYLDDPSPAFAGPLYRIFFQWGVHNETVISLGVAAAAIERLVQLAAVKTPHFSLITLRDREMAQHHVGKSARAGGREPRVHLRLGLGSLRGGRARRADLR